MPIAKKLVRGSGAGGRGPLCGCYRAAIHRGICVDTGLNDGLTCAGQLSNLLRGRLCHVNLIGAEQREGDRLVRAGTNPGRSLFKRAGTVRNFRHHTAENGSDIQGACGQLRRRVLEGGIQDDSRP